MDGPGTNGELAVLNETGLALAPDVVMLDFYLNAAYLAWQVALACCVIAIRKAPSGRSGAGPST